MTAAAETPAGLRVLAVPSTLLGFAPAGGFANDTPGPTGRVVALGGLGSAACVWLLLPMHAAAGLPVTERTI